VIRGEADAERNRILAEAYGQDPEFFGFIRSLSAYEASLKGGNSSIVMQPDSEFFDYLRSDRGPDVEDRAPAPLATSP
jgi:modulator of FtsH protease HflC